MLDGAAADPDRAPARPVPGLCELTWLLHGVAVALALAYAVTALLRAQTVPAATGAGAALLLAAVVALAGTLLLRRPPLPDVGAGILTLAVIGALGRIASVAFPGPGAAADRRGHHADRAGRAGRTRRRPGVGRSSPPPRR